MTRIEKVGLLFLFLFFNNDFSLMWRGLEIIIFFIGNILFLNGDDIIEYIKKVKNEN